MPEPRAVRSMFARIAGSYDLLNRVLSLGIDQRWRRAAVRRLKAHVRPEGVLADVCTGTGDLAIAFARDDVRTIAVDFTHEMVARAPRKVKPGFAPVTFLQGDALRLPLPDNCVDVATVSFGIRNVADRHAGLREMSRIVRPGGIVFVLEFSQPASWFFGGLYRLYFTRILPLIGRLLSKDKEAYEYLPRTVLAWPKPGEFEQEFRAEGLVDCGYQPLTFGIACFHWGSVPAESSL
jgi:demethylmenaquinone methyltransferase / 2-methoxy-6-polyprenyl-1,4-benzoquinol methylase